MRICSYYPEFQKLIIIDKKNFAIKEVNAITNREPIVLIPGFASSRLIAWKYKDCGAGFNIHIGDRVWLDVKQVVYDSFRESCWVRCMKLQVNQSDPTDCKLRTVGSIEAISELDPGEITGPLSSIFKDIIDVLVNDYNYDPTNLAAAPYDWRLPPSKLEERDSYFSNLKSTFEDLVQFNRKPCIIIAHSMGNNIFLYFVEWIKTIYPNEWQEWFDSHISTFFAVGAPLLGSTNVIKTAFSGETFGLPISASAVREFMVTFGSAPWLFPIPDPRGESTSYPMVTIDYQAIKKSSSYEVEALINGSLLSETGEFDPALKMMERMLAEFYLTEEINPLVPPARPPVDRVFCIYGINEATEIGFHYKIIDEAFRLKKSLFEELGDIYSQTALLSRKTFLEKSKRKKSGDGTVPYNSLNYCNVWHNPLNITTLITPTTIDQTSRLKGLLHMLGIEKLIYGVERTDSFDHVNNRSIHTSIIELERINHRDIIRNPKLLEVIKKELKDRVNVPFTPFLHYHRAHNVTNHFPFHCNHLNSTVDQFDHSFDTSSDLLNHPKSSNGGGDHNFQVNNNAEEHFVNESNHHHHHHQCAFDGHIIQSTIYGPNDGSVCEVPDIRDDDEGSEFHIIEVKEVGWLHILTKCIRDFFDIFFKV